LELQRPTKGTVDLQQLTGCSLLFMEIVLSLGVKVPCYLS
jgi:hypothetical protein